MESWYTDNCPKCGSVNWVCNGDESDMTRPDIDGVKCWNCKTVWLLEDQRIVSEDDNYFIEDGEKR